MSGETPSFSMRHSPSGVKKRKNGTTRKPPSIRLGLAEIPISPPQVRLPISGPSPVRLNAYGMKSPPEPASWSISIALGP